MASRHFLFDHSARLYRRFKILLLLPLKKGNEWRWCLSWNLKVDQTKCFNFKVYFRAKGCQRRWKTSAPVCGRFLRGGLASLSVCDVEKRLSCTGESQKRAERTTLEWNQGGISLGCKCSHRALCHPNPQVIHPNGLLMPEYQVQ